MSENNVPWSAIEKELIVQINGKLETGQDFDPNEKDDSLTCLLHLASQTGMAELCQLLLNSQASPNQTDLYGRTPLMFAASRGFEDIVNLLLEHNAKVDLIDNYGFSTAMHAVYSGNIEIIRKLVPENKRLTEYSDNTFLGKICLISMAASAGKNEIVQGLIDEDANCIDQRVEVTGMTPLMLALCGKHTATAEFLAESGADLHATSSSGLSAVGYAYKLNIPLLKLKIPDIKVNDEEWTTPTNKIKRNYLTPNMCISPKMKPTSPLKAFRWIKSSLKPKRSRSVETLKRNKNIEKAEGDEDQMLKSIFEISKMQQYWPLFKEQEITLDIFLTLNEGDLKSIGISKSSTRNKLLELIEHYRKLFYHR